MKKFYAVLVLAAITILGVSAKGDLSNAVMLDGKAEPAAVTAIKKAPGVKLSDTKLNRSSMPVKKAGKKVARKEAPANDVNLDEWNYLGEGKYGDGLVSLMLSYGYATEAYSYNVPIYQNKADENKYLFYDIYPADYIGGTYYFGRTDDKASTATFTISGSTVSVDFDINLYYYSEENSVEFNVKSTGTHSDGVFSFAKGAVEISVPALDSTMEGLAFTAQLSAGNEGGEEGGEQDINLDDWTLLGEAEYTDGIINASWGSREDMYGIAPYKVLAYRNKTNGNQFLLANIFPAELLSSGVTGYCDFSLKDGKESNLILTVDPETKEVTAQYLSTLEEVDYGLVEIEQRATSGKGKFDNATITFAAKAFVLNFKGETSYHDSWAISIALPEGTELVEGGSEDPETGGVDLTKWTALGKAKYTDGFLYVCYSATEPFPAYEVDAYVSKTNENQYLLYDIYPTSYLNETGNKYSQIDGKASSVIFTVNPTDNTVTAEYDIQLIDNSDGTAFTVEPDEDGTYNEGSITFPDQAFMCCYDGEGWGWSLPFTVLLPGAKDYSFYLNLMSDICNADNKMGFGIAVGDGVTTVKWGMFSGLFSATEGNLQYLASAGSAINPGTYNYTFDTTDPEGYYTLMAVGLDDKGNVVNGNAIYFYKNTPINAEEWVSLGQVDFSDDSFQPILFKYPQYETYKVELLESKVNPGTLCLVNPYKDMPFYSQSFQGHSDCNHYIKIDATDVTEVSIPMVPMGVSFGDNEDLSIESIKAGTIADGKLTFPTRGLVVYISDMTGYYANQNGKFDLQVPNLLKVTVTAGDQPVEGAVVTFEDWSVDGITTDAEGVAYFPYPADNTLKIIAYKDGYDVFEIPAATARYAEVDAALVAAKAQLTVIVSDEEGEPVADAWVYFQDKEVQTGENGQAVIADIDAPAVLGTEVDYSVYKDGYEYFEGKADFTESLEAYAMATLQAAKASLTVIVSDEEGEPVADAWVYFQDKELQTGENGQVVISDLNGPAVIGKQIDFTVYKDGYEAAEVKADFSETLDAYTMVTLQAAKAQLTVIVSDEEGEPIADAWVYFGDKEVQTGENGQVVITDIDALEVLGKNVDFSVYKDGYEYYEGKADFTETLEAYAIVTLQAAKAQLTVIALDKVTDEPIAGAKVTFLDNEYTTGENGQVVISDINALEVLGKEVAVSITHDHYAAYTGSADFTEGLEATVIAYMTESMSGIDAIIRDINNGDAEVYDLNGRRVKRPVAGNVYIVNGIKVLVK